MREQIGTVQITRRRVYPLDPMASSMDARTEVVVQPGVYPVFCDHGMTWYWQMTGVINGNNRRLGDGMFIIGSGDEATGDEVTFYSPRFGEDEWADLLSEMDVPGAALVFNITEGAQR